VDITAQINYQNGQVNWIFRTLDPETGELPEDALAGFLPPNDATRRGEGHVSFSIRPRSDLAEGTSLANQATIVFDVNEPIATNEVTNTVAGPLVAPVISAGMDAGGPALTWTQSQAGIARYEVYRSTNPYFAPGDQGSQKLGVVTAPGLDNPASYVDTAALGQTYFYVVLALSAGGSPSPASNRVGAFHFTLTPGAP
jgi:hypothetical protein